MYGDTENQQRHSVSPVHYRLVPGGSSEVIKLNGKCYLSDEGFVNVSIIGKIGYVSMRKLMLVGAEGWVDAVYLNGIKTCDKNLWNDIASYNSSLTNFALVANSNGEDLSIKAYKTTSGEVRVSGFSVFMLA